VTSVVIDAVHRGPARSGNGGWTAGVLAAHLPGSEAVTVTLRRPPPLSRPLAVRRDGEGAELLDGDRVVAEAAPAGRPPPVAAVSAGDARAAEATYAGLVTHPFPGCFVCGTEPAAGVGMRLRPGRVGPGRTACTWTPRPGHGSAAHVWAALDCPGGWTDDIEGRPMVLGRMTAAVLRGPRVGEDLVVVGVLLDRGERKSRTATTVYDAAGREVGSAVHTWIRVDPHSFA
jgi:hypothetical protein